MNNLRARMGYWGGVAKSLLGLSGGIFFLWRLEVDIDIWQVSPNFIHAVFGGEVGTPI